MGSGESDWGGGVLGEMLGRVAEGLGVVLPELDEPQGGIPVYVAAGLGRRVRVHQADEQRRAFWVCLQGNGQRLACGRTADPAEVVRAAAVWIGGAGQGDRARQATASQSSGTSIGGGGGLRAKRRALIMAIQRAPSEAATQLSMMPNSSDAMRASAS